VKDLPIIFSEQTTPEAVSSTTHDEQLLKEPDVIECFSLEGLTGNLGFNKLLNLWFLLFKSSASL